MALTMTPQASLGTPMPRWTLPGVDGRTYSSHAQESHSQPRDAILLTTGKPTVIMFLCNHCPYVKAVETRVLELARELGPKGAQFFAICSNDAADHPEDSFEKIQETWQIKAYPFPYLYDEDQTAAKAFGAVCTPDFFLYDHNMRLSYRGRLDDSWKDPSQVRKEDLKTAILDALASRALSIPEHPSMGCSIKWKR